MAFYAYVHIRPGADAHGAFYVGKGRDRRSHDFSRRNLHHTHIINKYGPENIDVAQIECSSEALAFDLERGLIRCLRKMGVNLVNATDGGEGVSGLRHSEQSRAQMSAKRVGKSPSEETKTKMSEVRRGQANHFFGKSHSDETKKRISEAKKANPTDYWSGKSRGEETRRKISEALTGRVGVKHTEASRAKISASKKGRPAPSPSEETRAKLSLAIKEIWRKRKQTIIGENL
jgi:hypothetical protein